MDRSWMYGVSRVSDEYLTGVDEFIKVAMEDMANNGNVKMACPGRDCNNNQKWSNPVQVRNHLIRRGFKQDYTRWIWHGESLETGIGTSTDSRNQEDHKYNSGSDVQGDGNDDMVVDEGGNFVQMLRDLEDDFGNDMQYRVFENLYEDSKKYLYHGCTKFTKLQGVLKLYNLKASNGWSDKSFIALLEVLREMLPDGNEISCNVYEVKKMLCTVDLKVPRIHAYPNDCILYINEYADLHECPKCDTSRYIRKKVTNDNSDDSKLKKGPPAKALWYLPVISRFKRLFINAEEAKLLHWHAEDRKNVCYKYIFRPLCEDFLSQFDSWFALFSEDLGTFFSPSYKVCYKYDLSILFQD